MTHRVADVLGRGERPAARVELGRIGASRENFMRWFGDSKVVDQHGHPLVVYHGTRTADEMALRGFTQGGAHFGTSLQAFERAKGGVNTATFPVFLSIKNPKRLIDAKRWSAGIYQKAQAEGHDGIVYLNRYEGIDEPDVGDETMSDVEFMEVHPEATDSYIAFEPFQIKSAFACGFDAKCDRLAEAGDADQQDRDSDLEISNEVARG